MLSCSGRAGSFGSAGGLAYLACAAWLVACAGSGGAPNGSGAGASSGGAAASTSAGASGIPNAGSAVGGATSSGGSAGVATGGSSPAGGSAGTTGGAGPSGGTAGSFAPLDPANPPTVRTLSGSLGAHDPAIIQAGSTYYVFTTGTNIPVKRSTDLTAWQDGGRAFSAQPAWMASSGIPFDSNNTMWAPDVSFFGGSYHLYYSVSSFGDNRSCIGHATRPALDTGAWTDRGSVICSNPDGGNTDDWNAIDPNVIVDAAGTPWMSFGSFWGGLKLIRLNAEGARADMELISIARRTQNEGSVEAPYIVRRGGYYYLFASFDFCCRAANSTYRIMVGRATQLSGPYTDKAGVAMMSGGGTQIVAGDTRWHGPGHNSVLVRGNEAFNVYHAYDVNNNGRSFLRISGLAWDAEGWPVSAGP